MAFLDEWLGKVWPGDCMEFMRRLPDGCVDLTLTDPPYGVGLLKDDTCVFQWFDDARRISRNLVFTPGIVNVREFPKADWVLSWRKPAACSRGKGGFNTWEPILVYGTLSKPAGKADEITAHLGVPEADWHPCPKPPKLWSELVQRYSIGGGIVFDPFMGSGTTGLICEQLGRPWLGCEINPTYAALAEKRIAAERARVKLDFSEATP